MGRTDLNSPERNVKHEKTISRSRKKYNKYGDEKNDRGKSRLRSRSSSRSPSR